jgi:hypothetical protein
MTRYKLTISINCGSVAEKVNRIVSPDNGAYITSRAEGETIEAEAEADNLNSLLRTADDFIVCVEVAVRALERGSGP